MLLSYNIMGDFSVGNDDSIYAYTVFDGELIQFFDGSIFWSHETRWNIL